MHTSSGRNQLITGVRQDEVMTKQSIARAPFYLLAVILGTYLSSGQSLAHHVAYVSVSLFATYMSQRDRGTEILPVSHLPVQHPAHDDDRVTTLAHVEELLSAAS